MLFGQGRISAICRSGLVQGEFTEEVIQRFLFDIDGSASVSEEETNKFVDESVDYFLRLVEQKGLPPVVLYINDTVSRKEVLNRFVVAIRQFSGAEKPIDVLVFDVFSKNASVMEEAQEMRGLCDSVLDILPREVPLDVYEPYYVVLERVVYLCEALNISLTVTTAENFFYALRLVSVGKLFEHLAENSDDSADGAFLLATQKVIQLLEQ